MRRTTPWSSPDALSLSSSFGRLAFYEAAAANTKSSHPVCAVFTLPCLRCHVYGRFAHSTLGHRVYDKVSVANTPLIRAPVKTYNRTNVVIQHDTLSSQACAEAVGSWEELAALVDRWR